MGAYKKEIVCEDFDIVVDPFHNSLSEKLKVVALEILETLPDNMSRDLAISHLLQSASFIKASIILGE